MVKSIECNLEFLRQKSKELTTQKEVDSIIKDLEDTLDTLKGYGLAAIQIGNNKQIAIVRMDKCKVNLINPKIVSKEDKFVFRGEGCLSFPELKIDTDRYLYITIESGLEGQRNKYALEGLESIVVLHEIDHLNGITILDRKHRRKK